MIIDVRPHYDCFGTAYRNILQVSGMDDVAGDNLEIACANRDYFPKLLAHLRENDAYERVVYAGFRRSGREGMVYVGTSEEDDGPGRIAADLRNPSRPETEHVLAIGFGRSVPKEGLAPIETGVVRMLRSSGLITLNRTVNDEGPHAYEFRDEIGDAHRRAMPALTRLGYKVRGRMAQFDTLARYCSFGRIGQGLEPDVYLALFDGLEAQLEVHGTQCVLAAGSDVAPCGMGLIPHGVVKARQLELTLENLAFHPTKKGCWRVARPIAFATPRTALIFASARNAHERLWVPMRGPSFHAP